MIYSPKEVCQMGVDEVNLSHVRHGNIDRCIVSCFNHPRNTKEARAAAGLNPEFSGCPACHNKTVKSEETIRADMRQFMEDAIYREKPIGTEND